MRHHEFWHPRVFEAPYYLYLLTRCLLYRLPPRDLAKANYDLDHGELGLGSKYATQMLFPQERFLPTVLLKCDKPQAALDQSFLEFTRTQGLPLILKPDIGAVGKGITKIHDVDAGLRCIQKLEGDYLLQSFTPHNVEHGVFFARSRGVNLITGINRKHFPTIVGNGRNTIAELAALHPRFTEHWPLFLQYLDTERIPEDRERVQLSFIGSHTMGCAFTDDTACLTPTLADAVFELCDAVPGFNFGRLDVKSSSEAAFARGEFVVIEINGIASLPTHMFDPTGSLVDAYRIFFQHGRLLTKIAQEHRDRDMPLDSYTDIWRKAKANHRLLNAMHARAKTSHTGL